MKARIIQAIAEGARDAACMTWRAGALVERAIGHVCLKIYRVVNAIPTAIDPDRAECRECGEPGGMHIDCDEPDAGKWTATERAQIEAYHARMDAQKGHS